MVFSAALAVALGIAFAGSGNAFVHRQPALLNLVLVLFARAALGAAVATLLLLMLRGRAPRLARALSCRGWLPFARLSYSAYLFQVQTAPHLAALFTLAPASDRAPPHPPRSSTR